MVASRTISCSPAPRFPANPPSVPLLLPIASAEDSRFVAEPEETASPVGCDTPPEVPTKPDQSNRQKEFENVRAISLRSREFGSS